MLAAEAAVALADRRAYRWLHLTLVALIAAVFFVQLEKRVFDSPASLMILVALGFGALLAYGLARTRFVRSLLDVLSVAPVVFVAIFLFFSETSELVLPQEDTGALGVEVPSTTPVVMLVFDELPTATLMDERGRIDAERYPNFARLAAHSTWYPDNTTVADFTGRAVPAIFTGNRPAYEDLPIASSQPNSIFSLLGGSYDLQVEEAVTQICPENLCGEVERPSQSTRLKDLAEDLRYVEGRLILPPALANSLPEVTNTFGDFGNNEGGGDARAGEFARDLFSPPDPAEFEKFLAAIPAAGRTLSMIHMELPHEPFRYLPDGQAYEGRDISNLNSENSARWAVGAAGIATVQQRHYLQTGYADTLVGLMLDRLEQEGILDEAMVIVTADHGISFVPGIPRRVATPRNLGGVANPPLLIHYPGQRRGRISRAHTRTIDIVPTIAEVLGVEIPYETDGEPIAERTPGGEVSVSSGRDEEVTVPLSLLLSQRAAYLERAAFRLGTDGLYALGPAPDLLGTPAPPLSVGLDSERTAGIEELGSYEDFDPEAEEIPALVSGTLEGVEAGTLIAIAMNGRVAATTRAFSDEGEVRYGAVVPPSSLRPGSNSIGIYEADGETLTPLGGS